MEENQEKEIVAEAIIEPEIVPETLAQAEVVAQAEIADNRPPRREFKKNTRKPPRREPRAKQEFDNKLLEIRRVARVTSGGRRFSFSASVVAGDKKGKIGVGIGKAADTPIAIDKAIRDAKKNMVKINMKDSSIAHEVEAKYGASVITIRPSPGKGIVAGSSVRAVLELAGISEVSAKIWSRSKNKINNARAAIKALEKLKSQ